MKSKSLLFAAVAITLVAAVSYYIGSSKQGTNTDQQSTPTAEEPEHSAPSKINAVEAMSQEKVAEPGISPMVSEKIEAIEVDFERRKQKIEEYYADCFRRLRENVEIALRKLNAVDKAAYAQFIEKLNNTTSTSSGYTSLTGHVSPDGTVSADGLHAGTTHTRVVGKPASDYGSHVQRTNKAIDNLMGEYQLDFEHYQRRRACALDDLEKQKKLALAAVSTRSASPSVSARNAGRSVQPISPTGRGIVTGIWYSEDSSRIVIDGKVVGEGQSVNGVRVVKILQDCVEFESKGSRWRQRVNEPPSAYWP